MILTKDFYWVDDKSRSIPLLISEIAVRLALSDTNRNNGSRSSYIPELGRESFMRYKMSHLHWSREDRMQWTWSYDLPHMTSHSAFIRFSEAYPNLHLYLDFNLWN